MIPTAQRRTDAASVVVLGAGHAGFQVASSLRELGHGGRITLVGEEPHWPYRRPPLSKGYLESADLVDTLELRPKSYFDTHQLDLRTGAIALAIDRSSGTVNLESGERIGYDHLVLALGARPRKLRVPGEDLGGVIALRTSDHAEALRDLFREPGDMVVIGGGFIGMEVASVAAKAGQRVTIVEAGDRVMARVVAPEISGRVVREHAAHGITILTGRIPVAFRGEAGQVCAVELDGGITLPARIVLVGIGVLPNTALAEAAGLVVDNGIVVDGRLLTSDTRISAIGDCASFPSVHARRRVRLESVQNATDQARHVAARLIGRSEEIYQGIPSFWTRQYGMSIQTVGIGGVDDERWISGDPAVGAFSVFRFSNGTLTSVESFNCPADQLMARKLFGAGAPLPTLADLTDALFSPTLSLTRVASGDSSDRST